MHQKPSGKGDQPLNIWGCFIMKFVHLRSFPLNYEIANNGDIRIRTTSGFIKVTRYFEESGTFVDIEINNKIHKCLLAELLLESFIGSYSKHSYRIRYKDGNIHNVNMDNCSWRRMKTELREKYIVTDKHFIGLWRCASRADAANARYKALNQTITPNEVLRCLQVCNFKCFYCEVGLNPLKWHLDHYLPMAKEGRNEFDNLRASCKECNMMKSDMTYEQWMSKSIQVYNIFIKHNPEYKFKADFLIQNIEIMGSKSYSNG